jgi:hypothetical protein
MRIKIIIASAVGVLCGYLSVHAFSIGWWNIILWGGAYQGNAVHRKEQSGV